MHIKYISMRQETYMLRLPALHARVPTVALYNDKPHSSVYAPRGVEHGPPFTTDVHRISCDNHVINE